MAFVFGEFEADEERFELTRRGLRVCVQPRVLETIFFFIHSGGRLVTKDDLIAGPWNGAIVSDGALSQVIMLARRALSGRYRSNAIATVRGRGFRFEAQVVPTGGSPTPTTTPSLPTGDAASIRARIARLPRRVRAALAAAAIIGVEFSLLELQRATAVPSDEALAALAPALALDLVEASDETQTRFQFTQAMIRDVLDQDLPSSLRSALHARVDRVSGAARDG